MFKKPLWQTVWTHIGAVSSGSTLFAFMLNSSVMLGNYLQQTTFSDAFFSWRFKGKPNGNSHLCQLDESISYLRVVG